MPQIARAGPKPICSRPRASGHTAESVSQSVRACQCAQPWSRAGYRAAGPEISSLAGESLGDRVVLGQGLPGGDGAGECCVSQPLAGQCRSFVVEAPLQRVELATEILQQVLDHT